MSNSMTPETDAMMETDAHRIEEYSAPLTAYRRMCELARTLERERDEWRMKSIDQHKQLAAERALADLLAIRLEMVRDADNDCHKEGLQTIPQIPRFVIDSTLAAWEEARK